MSYLQDIASFSQSDNMGGIMELRVCRKRDIDAIPDPVDGIIYGDITFKAGKGWAVWHVTHSTPEYSGQSKGSQEGDYKDNAVAFVVPKDRPGIRRMFELAEKDEHILSYKDRNGNQKIVGTLEAPVYFRFDQRSGGSTSQRNAYACQFYSEGPDNSYFYNGLLATAPAGTAPAIVTVNGQFIASLAPGETIDFDFEFDFDYEITGS